MDKSKIDLTKPAFGPEAQLLTEVAEGSEETQTEVSQPKEEIKDEEVQTDDSVEEQKVPYSRFKKYHDMAKEFEEKLQAYDAKFQEFSKSREVESNTSLPDYWVELYGDSDASEKAFKITQSQNETIKREAVEEAKRAYREEIQQENLIEQRNVETIDSNLEALSDALGRGLTQKEESALLDIVDDFTPKDRDGNYIGATIPFEKAWEIYEMKQNSINAPKKQSRDSVAALNGTSSQGESSVQADKDKNFNPLAWNSWKSRL